MRRLLAALTLSSALVAPAAGQASEVGIGDMSSYLEEMDTVRAGFTQVNGDGTIDTGTLYIDRPGRMRFEYDPPHGGTVLAGSGAVAIFDDRGSARPEQYPLGQTPLGILLARDVALEKGALVSGATYDGSVTRVTARDPARPRAGALELAFTGDPVELRSWVMQGQDGSETTVILNDIARGMKLNRGLFNIVLETRRRERER